jgi:putative transposase
MAIARSEVVIDGVEAVYHCISRCVRRAFLCGTDTYTGKSYEHRKEWIRLRIQELTSGYAIEVSAYAVMSNHLHVVLRTRPDWVDSWTDKEVAIRWLKMFSRSRMVEDKDAPPSDSEIKRLTDHAERMTEIRSRLSSVSWFMRSLNEHVARLANREDGCKGRFWEGRFKCQALLDEAAVLACMAYVDLNPIRAGLAETPGGQRFYERQGTHRGAPGPIGRSIMALPHWRRGCRRAGRYFIRDSGRIFIPDRLDWTAGPVGQTRSDPR